MRGQIKEKTVNLISSLNDDEIIRVRKRAQKILVAPYKRGINYVMMVDLIRTCADQMYENSVRRALNKV